MFFIRWNNDSLCVNPFPRNFESYEKTLSGQRKKKFGKSPTTPSEIESEFSKSEILEMLGTSLYREKGRLYNGIQIEDDYCNCFFSSSKAISLVKENLELDERFFIMDATFRVTPHGIFQQLLILYIQFGIKV